MRANPILQRIDYNALIEGVRDIGVMQLARQATAPQNQRVKPDGSLVSDVDLESEKRMQEILKRVGAFEILSEEASQDDNHRAMQSKGPIWVIDPLDGTTNYLSGKLDFSIYAGLLSAPDSTGNRTPIFGMVYKPSSRTIHYTGQKGTSLHSVLSESGTNDALFERTPEAIHAAPLQKNPDGSIALLRVGVGSHDGTDFFDGLATKIERQKKPSYSMAIARGEIDAGICPHRVSIWDTVAIDAILRQSGGSMLPVDPQKKRVLAHGLYYGPEAQKYFEGKPFYLPPYISINADIMPHLSYAEGVPTPPAQPARKR